MGTMTKVILISKSGDTKEITIEKTKNSLSKILKNKGNGKIENLNNWNYEGTKIQLYGYNNGEAGNENKFELPPPLDNELFFGDMVFLKDSNSNMKDLDLDEFLEFYNETMGGFEDLEDSEEEEDELLEYRSSEDSEWKPS